MRHPVVAGSFYPAEQEELDREIDRLMPVAAAPREATGVIVPHAGYVYSGATAGEVFGQVVPPDTAVILGPNHRGRGALAALSLEPWSTPLGVAEVDEPLARDLLYATHLVRHDETAHQAEHSLEVQVPFIQRRNPAARILPLALGPLSLEQCAEVARGLASAVRAAHDARRILLVASTDMTHYESRERARDRDRAALDHIRALDPAGLYATVLERGITMCGVIPTTVMLMSALDLGVTRCDLVCYTDSGEVNGDTARVVSYAGLILS